ncbi:MAG TPA: acyl-CoA dehydrogenase family protein [Acidimicrobiia bacterium]|nr:acyl-CoA dehydrogenase family protein [Acidimicrobiia bacterium]
MRFAFSDEQLAMRDAVRAFLEKECPPKVVRDAWTNDTGRSGLWPRLGELGVLGVLAPEELGGFGGDELDLVLLLEETGRAALPDPVVEHAAVAVPLLDDARTEAAAAGDLTVTVAPPSGLVPYADSSDLVVVGDQLVDPGALELRRRESVDRSRRLFALASPPSSINLASLDRAALGVAAQLVGVADRMLTMTVEYAKERRQFGVPIGSFQAVKHHLADVALSLEFSRPLVYRAAWSIAHRDEERSVHVAMAKARASEAALRAGRVALQVHGAIGYTTEYDLHLWMKRAWALAASWGDAAWHGGRVGRAILDTETLPEEH